MVRRSEGLKRGGIFGLENSLNGASGGQQPAVVAMTAWSADHVANAARASPMDAIAKPDSLPLRAFAALLNPTGVTFELA